MNFRLATIISARRWTDRKRRLRRYAKKVKRFGKKQEAKVGKRRRCVRFVAMRQRLIPSLVLSKGNRFRAVGRKRRHTMEHLTSVFLQNFENSSAARKTRGRVKEKRFPRDRLSLNFSTCPKSFIVGDTRIYHKMKKKERKIQKYP